MTLTTGENAQQLQKGKLFPFSKAIFLSDASHSPKDINVLNDFFSFSHAIITSRTWTHTFCTSCHIRFCSHCRGAMLAESFSSHSQTFSILPAAVPCMLAKGHRNKSNNGENPQPTITTTTTSVIIGPPWRESEVLNLDVYIMQTCTPCQNRAFKGFWLIIFIMSLQGWKRMMEVLFMNFSLVCVKNYKANDWTLIFFFVSS